MRGQRSEDGARSPRVPGARSRVGQEGSAPGACGGSVIPSRLDFRLLAPACWGTEVWCFKPHPPSLWCCVRAAGALARSWAPGYPLGSSLRVGGTAGGTRVPCQPPQPQTPHLPGP